MLPHRHLAMDPDAIHDSEPEHDHKRERAAVTDERQWHAGNRQNGNRHSNVLEDVSENEGAYSNDEQQPKQVARFPGNEKTRHQEKGKGAKKCEPPDESPLLSNRRKDVVVMHRGRWEKAEFDLGVGRFESFARPTPGANRDQ